jgi:hypothetical protein
MVDSRGVIDTGLAMTALFDTSVIYPILVSRGPQLDALDRLVAQAADGRGQAALIAAEAGIGKSRLVAEVKTHAAARFFAVLQGRCFEPDHVLPDAPLGDLLRGDLAEHAPDAIAPASAQWRHSSPACCPNATRCSPISRPFLRSTRKKIGVDVLVGRSHS